MLVVGFVSAGLMSMSQSIGIIMGANVGTTITAQVVAFKVTKAALPLVGVGFVLWFIPKRATTLLLLPFSTLLARAVIRLVPDTPLSNVGASVHSSLPPELMQTPTLALDAVRREIQRMGDVVLEMLDATMPAIFKLDSAALEKIEARDTEVDQRHAALVEYLGQLSTKPLMPKTSMEVGRLMTVANHVESIGDIIETNLVHLGRALLESDVRIGEEKRKRLLDLKDMARHATAEALGAVADNDPERARRVIEMKPVMSSLVDLAQAHEADRLVAEEPNRIVAYTNEIDIIEKLNRIYYFAKRMAKLA